MTDYVRSDQLVFDSDGVPFLGGSVFTGVAFEDWPDGHRKSETRYYHGMLDGVAKEWYDSGQLKAEEEYETNGAHGFKREWYRDGTRKSEAYFQFGIPFLTKKEWAPDGAVTTVWRYPKTGKLYLSVEKRRQRKGLGPLTF